MRGGEFKLLYDGQCPFCRREIAWLKRRDRDGQLIVEDISTPEFRADRYGLTQDAVEKVIHGILPDGRIVRRVEALRRRIVSWDSAGLLRRQRGRSFAGSPTWPMVSSRETASGSVTCWGGVATIPAKRPFVRGGRSQASRFLLAFAAKKRNQSEPIPRR